MKKLISLAIAAVFVSTALTAQAEILKNLTTSGEIEVQYLNMRNNDLNTDNNDEINQTRTRVMYGLNFDLLDDVNAQVTLYKNNRLYNSGTQENVDTLTANVTLSEAYINLKDVIGLDHKVGKQYFGEPGDLIIYYGPLRQPWTLGMEVTSLDGLFSTWTNDKFAITGGLAKITEVGGAIDSDMDLRTLLVNYNASEAVNITGYWYNRVENDSNAAPQPTDHLSVIGVKGTGKINAFHYKGEVAVNTGKASANVDTQGGSGNTYNTATAKYKGIGFLVNAGYDFDLPFGALGVNGEFVSGSGDNKLDKEDKTFYAINSDYRPGIIVGGTGLDEIPGGNTVGIDNLTSWNLGVKFTPEALDKLTTCLKYYSFSQTKIPTGAAYKKAIGTEIDFVATWKHSDNVSVRGSLARFTTAKNSYITRLHEVATTRLNPATRVGLDWMLKF